MKTYIVAKHEDQQLSISLFARIEDAQQYYCDQVCDIYEYEQCGNIVAEMNAGNMAKAYELAKDLFEDRENSDVDSMVLEERDVPNSKQTEPDGPEEAERWDAIREMAKEQHESEGDLEIDEDAVVSEGDDNGAYVQCWKWIDFTGTPLSTDINDSHDYWVACVDGQWGVWENDPALYNDVPDYLAKDQADAERERTRLEAGIPT